MKYVNRKRQYFRKQKLMGLSIVLLSVFAAFLLEGDITFTLLAAPVGLYLMFTKEMLIVNDYYYECKQHRSVNNRRP